MVGLAITLLAACAGSSSQAEVAAPTNIVMVSIDTFQRDRMGRYSGADTTPFLDGLLADSLVLDNHRSCSNYTFHSVLCALGGADPVDLGYVPYPAYNKSVIPPDLTLLAGYAGQNGFASALVSANGYLGPHYGTSQGYDAVEIFDKQPAEDLLGPAEALLDALIAGEKPWLFHVHFMDPHLPYDPPASYLGGIEDLDPVSVDLTDTRSIHDLADRWEMLSPQLQRKLMAHLDLRYAGEFAYADDGIRALFEAMEARGALDDALVVFWSDHGEQLDEHGGLGHTLSMYDEELRSVVAFRAPGLEPGSWTGPTTHADLLPTVADFMGWSLPERGPTAGVPAGQADPLRPMLAEEFDEEETLQAVISGDRKLIYRWTGDWEYYELDADPLERQDLSATADYADLQALVRDQAARLFEYYPYGPAPQ